MVRRILRSYLKENGLPDPVNLGERAAAMHKNISSPTGKLGFLIQTFDGARLQASGLDPSWASFFSKLLAEAYRQDAEANGLWPELDAVYSKVRVPSNPKA
jgi:fructosamine-3-kinase